MNPWTIIGWIVLFLFALMVAGLVFVVVKFIRFTREARKVFFKRIS